MDVVRSTGRGTADDVARHKSRSRRLRSKSMEGGLVGLEGEAWVRVDMVGMVRSGRKLESDSSNYDR